MTYLALRETFGNMEIGPNVYGPNFTQLAILLIRFSYHAVPNLCIFYYSNMVVTRAISFLRFCCQPQI